MLKLTNSFSITVTEHDRKAAKRFSSHTHCLVATMFRRRGHKKVSVDPLCATVEGKEYRGRVEGCERALCGMGYEELRVTNDRQSYLPSIVGKKIFFERREKTSCNVPPLC